MPIRTIKRRDQGNTLCPWSKKISLHISCPSTTFCGTAFASVNCLKPPAKITCIFLSKLLEINIIAHILKNSHFSITYVQAKVEISNRKSDIWDVYVWRRQTYLTCRKQEVHQNACEYLQTALLLLGIMSERHLKKGKIHFTVNIAFYSVLLLLNLEMHLTCSANANMHYKEQNIPQ